MKKKELEELVYAPQWGKLSYLTGVHLSPSKRRSLLRYWPWDWEELYERVEQEEDIVSFYQLERIVKEMKDGEQYVPPPATEASDDKEDEIEFTPEAIPTIAAEMAASAIEPIHKLGSSFLSSFLNYTQIILGRQDFSCLLCGLALWGVALGKAWAWVLGQRLKPSLYALLYGPSGYAGKTTLLQAAHSLLIAAIPELAGPQAFSPEGLLATLAERPVLLCIVDEFTSLVGGWMREYARGNLEILTSLWTTPPMFVRRLRQKAYKAEAPSLSLLSSTNPALLGRYFQHFLGSGIYSRFLVARHDTPLPISMPPGEEFKTEKEALEWLKSALYNATVYSGRAVEVELPGERLRAIASELLELYQREGEIEPYASRSLHHVAKLAILLRLDGWPNYMEAAREIVETSLQAWQRIVDEDLPRHDDERLMRELVSYIKRDGQIPRHDLLRKMQLRLSQFDALVRTLVERGEIEELVDPTDGITLYRILRR
ncbi:MAG: DUF3987 domain-containing protein [Nitrososphaerota archaeon]